MENKIRIIFMLIILSGIVNISAQSSNYILSENDSTLKLKDPIQLKTSEQLNSLFKINLREKIKNHVWFLSFEITNNTAEDVSINFGSEGQLELVTKTVILKAGETQLIKYKMRKFQDWAGFTQVGIITVYSKSKGHNEFDLYRNDLSGEFSIHGEWVY